MGGSGSTSFISWFSKRVATNCCVNSEGLKNKGPGANPKGLKHRIKPPLPNDPYIGIRIGDSETLEKAKIEKALFIFDTPYNIVPSLFRRKIAMGHAKAITGEKALYHENDLDKFIKEGRDSFHFGQQLSNWSNCRMGRPYKRMLVKFPYFWEYIEDIFRFLEVPLKEVKLFPPNKMRTRQSSFRELTEEQQEGLKRIYHFDHEKIVSFPKISIL
jgi:hypothetical protein